MKQRTQCWRWLLRMSTQTWGSQRGRERCVQRRCRDLGDWWRLRPQKISALSWQNKGFGITRTTNQSNPSIGTANRHPGQDLRPFLELWSGKTSVVLCSRLFLRRRNSEDKTFVGGVGWDPNGRPVWEMDSNRNWTRHCQCWSLHKRPRQRLTCQAHDYRRRHPLELFTPLWQQELHLQYHQQLKLKSH